MYKTPLLKEEDEEDELDEVGIKFTPLGARAQEDDEDAITVVCCAVE